MALILNGSDGTSLNPVDSHAVARLVEDLVVAVLLRFTLETEHASVLSSGPVGELVVAKSVAVALSVVLLNVLVEDGEVDKAGVEFLNISEVLSKLSQVVHVLELDGGESGGGTKGDGGGESFHKDFCFIL